MKIQIGISPTLAIIFILLKLANVIQWDWVWVLSPLWIGYILILLAGLLLMIVAAFNK